MHSAVSTIRTLRRCLYAQLRRDVGVWCMLLKMHMHFTNANAQRNHKRTQAANWQSIGFVIIYKLQQPPVECHVHNVRSAPFVF